MNSLFGFPKLTQAGRLRMTLVLAGGAIVELVLAAKTLGLPFDISWWQHAGQALERGLALPYTLHLWNYTPGFLPVAAVADKLSHLTSVPFHFWVKVPSVAAVVALAWLVQGELGRRGASEVARLCGAALVVVGPVFLVIIPYGGQMDSLAILPAFMGLLLWERDVPHRAVWAGALVGLAILFKTPAGFTLLALLPSARGFVERVRLVAAGAVLPILGSLPFLIAAPAGTLRGIFNNRGVPGWGGVSALLQPAATRYWLTLRNPPRGLTPLNHLLYQQQNLIVLAGALLAGIIVYRARAGAVNSAIVIFATVLAVNPEWAFNFLVWALPFFLLTQRLAAIAVFQVVAAAACLIFYLHWHAGTLFPLYFVLVTATWLALVGLAIVGIVEVVGRWRMRPRSPILAWRRAP